jgi:isocitrate/isopropylmalate dehydrogenase
MVHRVVLIPGDGTEPELTEATRRVLEATGAELEWGVAPGKYAGQNRVNPIAQMLAGVTYDMKPSRDDPTAVGTSEVADAVSEKLEAEVPV